MIDVYALNPPPGGWPTPEQGERWQALKEELNDVYRQERELLLASYAHRPADHRPTEMDDDLEKFVRELSGSSELTREEKQGLLLLKRDELERWLELQDRAFSLLSQQFELEKEVTP